MMLRLLLIVTLLAGCVPSADTRDRPSAADPPADLELVSALRPFDDCAALGARLRDRALDVIGPYGLGPPPEMLEAADALTGVAGDAVAQAGPGAAGESGGRAAAGGSVDAGPSGTNVQVAGVDEGDLAKTDGDWLYTLHVADGTLRIVDIRSNTPRLVASVSLDGGHGSQLLLTGDRVLVLGEAPPPDAVQGGDSPRAIMPWQPRAQAWLIDVSEPTQPRMLSTMVIDGATVAARLTGQFARVVVRSLVAPPGLVTPQGTTPGDERSATATNRERIAQSAVTDWLPTAQVDGGAREPLVGCDAVREPPELGEFGMVSVMTLDMRAPTLTPDRTQAVLGAGATVYATAEHLYVTSGPWTVGIADVLPTAPAGQPRTRIHRFDTDGPTVTYVASGSVPGRLLNQWALSEHEGDLRVATTEDTGRDGSASSVRVLRARGGDLREIGYVGDLGRGERIYAVRYVGDIGFVVTFRQVDPLYTVDLSDPTRPRVLGELKIPGYSSYLHPVGDDMLLGVGQDADAQGRTQGVGVSLFDVADLAAPRRLDAVALGAGTTTPVEWDHHAFTYDTATRTAVIPVESYGGGPTGAQVLTVPADGAIVRRGVVTPRSDSGFAGAVQRAFVVGDRLVTLSPFEVLVSDVQTLLPLGSATFAQ